MTVWHCVLQVILCIYAGQGATVKANFFKSHNNKCRQSVLRAQQCRTGCSLPQNAGAMLPGRPHRQPAASRGETRCRSPCKSCQAQPACPSCAMPGAASLGASACPPRERPLPSAKREKAHSWPHCTNLTSFQGTCCHALGNESAVAARYAREAVLAGLQCTNVVGTGGQAQIRTYLQSQDAVLGCGPAHDIAAPDHESCTCKMFSRPFSPHCKLFSKDQEGLPLLPQANSCNLVEDSIYIA